MEKDYPQNIVQALTLVGLGVYAAIRFGQQLYCNKLQVTPEEVGLTYTASISRAAVILIAFLAPVIVAITLGLIYIVIRAPRVLDRLILLLTWTAVFVLLFLGGTALGMSGVTFMYVGAMVIGAGFIVGAAIVWIIGKLRQRYGTLFSYGVDGAGSQALYSRRFQLYYLVIIGSFVVLILFIAAFAGTEAARTFRADALYLLAGISVSSAYKAVRYS